MLKIIFLFVRNNTSHSAFGIGYVARIAWDDVHVAMEDGLPGGFAHVDAHVKAVWVETLVNLMPDILQHDVHGLALVIGQVEVGGDVPLGDDKRMTRRNRITIVECNTSCRFADDFHSTGQAAERTLLAFHTRQLVEMVVLVEFVAFVGDEALVRQFHVTLVRILLVDGMKPEAFFCQVTTDGKISRPFWGEQVGDIHQNLDLGIGFQDVQNIVTKDGVELALGKVGAVVVIVADDVEALLPEFVGIETETASEVENLALQQIVLHEVSRGHREISALDGR